MDNGYEEEGKLTKKFSELGLGFGLPGIFTVDPSSFNNNDSSLSQVMKAVEAAETTIKHQVINLISFIFFFFISQFLVSSFFFLGNPK